MTTITETFHDHANAAAEGFVASRAVDFRTADDGHTIAPSECQWPLDGTGTFTAVIEPGPTVFDLWIDGVNVRTRIVDVPDTGTHQLHDLAELADPGEANLDASVAAALSGLTWGDLA